MAKRRNKDGRERRLPVIKSVEQTFMALADEDGEPIGFVNMNTLEMVWTGDRASCLFCDQRIHHYHGEGAEDACPFCQARDFAQCWTIREKMT